MGTSTLDEARRENIPKCGGPAISQHHFITLGKAEKLGQSRLDPSDEVFYRSLAVRGPQNVLVLDQVVDLFSAHLAGSCTEATIEGKNVYGDLKRGHPTIVRAQTGATSHPQ